jgi:hypothetical protein
MFEDSANIISRIEFLEGELSRAEEEVRAAKEKAGGLKKELGSERRKERKREEEREEKRRKSRNKKR